MYDIVSLDNIYGGQSIIKPLTHILLRLLPASSAFDSHLFGIYRFMGQHLLYNIESSFL